MNGRIRIVATASVLLVALSAFRAHATDLGSDARTFVLLGEKVVVGPGAQAGPGGDSAANGAIGGFSVTLKAGSQSVNEVVASPGGISLKSGSNARGCITGGGQIKVAGSATCNGLTDDGGQNAELAVLSNAIAEALAFAQAVEAQTPTQTLLAVNASTENGATITNSQSGLNVISMPSITVRENAVLDLSGQAGDTDILRVDGDLKWGAGASVDVFGPTNNGVLYVVSGKVVSLGSSSQFEGTILAPNAKCLVGKGAQVIGNLLCKQVLLGAGSQVIFVPSAVTIP